MPAQATNARVYLAGLDLSRFANNATMAGTWDSADITVFGDSDREFRGTLISHSLTVSGFLDAAATGNASVLNTLHAATTTMTAYTYAPNLDTIGNPVYAGQILNSSLELGAPVDGIQTFALNATASAAFGQTKGFGFGRSLHALGAETMITNFTAVDNGTTSANGYLAVLHCTAFTSGSTTVKIQHSPTGAVWTDLPTNFTALTATGSQVVHGTGTVQPFVRAQITAISASTTFSVAFVRK